MNRGGTKSPTTPEGAMVWFSYDNYHFQTLDFLVVLVFLINISGCFLNHTEKNTRSMTTFLDLSGCWSGVERNPHPEVRRWRYESRLLDVLISAGSQCFPWVFLVGFPFEDVNILEKPLVCFPMSKFTLSHWDCRLQHLPKPSFTGDVLLEIIHFQFLSFLKLSSSQKKHFRSENFDSPKSGVTVTLSRFSV